MITRMHNADCPQEYLTAFGLDPARVIYFDIETTGFRASTSRLYMIGWAVRENPACSDRSDDLAERLPDRLSGDLSGDLSDSLPDDLSGDLSDSLPECLSEHLPDGSGSSCSESVPGTGDSVIRPGADPGHWVVTQIMAESSAEEAALLQQFEKVLSLYDTIIEFNGDRFDLPYMKEKYASYNLDDPFVHCRTVDLYREIKPFKNALGMSRLNQKSVETFLHITRNDPYNGGELIDVYRSFRNHSCEDEECAKDALFLHNYEDVLGMLKMTPLLSYHLAMHSSAPVAFYPEGASPEDSDYEVIEAGFDLDVPVPVPVHLHLGRETRNDLSEDAHDVVGRLQGFKQNPDRAASDRDGLMNRDAPTDQHDITDRRTSNRDDPTDQHDLTDRGTSNRYNQTDQHGLTDQYGLTDRRTPNRDDPTDQHDVPDAACSVTLAGNHAAITLRLLPRSLYHFFPDYRNYYYLPEEDTAIHKSVAAFVDASHREKAKAQNCYIRKSGLFLPQAGEHYQPVFHRFYKDSVSWFEYRQELMEDSDEGSAYIHALIRSAASVKE